MSELIKKVIETGMAKGMNRGAIAEALKIHRSTLSRLEHGHRLPKRDVLTQIIKAFPEMKLEVYAYLAGEK